MPKALEVGITLEVKSHEGRIKGNRTLIYRAVYNLVENGLKYCSKGHTVTLNSEVREKELIITVSDNGPGIPKESLDHIFEPFYRVDKSRSRSIGGSGLGLSIVKAIIEKHNGSIHAESTLGQGTTFIIELK
jgi:signal transduction histidine kinase